MEEAKIDAEQIYVNDDGVMKIICPFCGALQTPRRRSYEDAQDAAVISLNKNDSLKIEKKKKTSEAAEI